LRGYYTADAVRALFGVAIDSAGEIDHSETMRLRGGLERSA
jgi:hypothetical protein